MEGMPYAMWELLLTLNAQYMRAPVVYVTAKDMESVEGPKLASSS